jgi:hypothetical protein
VEHRRFQIEAYEQSPGKWRALVRHSDWTVIHVGSTRFSRFASPSQSTAHDALNWAHRAIDEGVLQ